MRAIHFVMVCGLAALAMAACDDTHPSATASAEPPSVATTATPTTSPPSAEARLAPTASAASSDTASAHADMMMNWYGGEAYTGEPALDVTAALVQAGGGGESFSFSKALVTMLGQHAVDAEVAKLDEQYGKDKVKGFVGGMDFAVKDSLTRATAAGVKLPAPAKLSGPELAKALIKAGQAPDGTFWSGRMFDVAVSHSIHDEVMADINKKVGADADELTHRILNQAMVDVAGALKVDGVKLASLH